MKRSYIVVAFSALALAGCGARNSGSASPEMMMKPAAPPVAVEALSTDVIEQVEGDSEPAPMDGSGSDGVVQYMAYSHALGMRLPVAAVEPTLQAHASRCKAAGPAVCVVINSNVYAYAEDNVSGTLQLRAIPSWIETFLSGAEAEAEAAKGDITNRQTIAEDLTVTIIDTGARLKAQTALQKRIEQLLADRPGKLGELLETERELARVNGEIDSLTASLKALRQRVDMSELSVNYETKINPVSEGALAPLSNALGSFFYNLASAVAAVITAFAVGLPWLLLIGALLWIWLRLIWPRIRRKKPPVV